MSAFDLIVIAAIALAALIGLWVGLVRMLLSVGGWIGAAAVTVYGFPYARPLAREMIEGALLSDIAAAGVLFVLSLVLFTTLSHLIAERVRGSVFGALDRSVGLVFGLSLGVVVTSTGFLVTQGLFDGETPPEWMRSAKTVPVLAWSARKMLSAVPTDWRTTAGAAEAGPPSAAETGQAAKKLMTPAPQTTPPKDKIGYGRSERREMDRLFNANQ